MNFRHKIRNVMLLHLLGKARKEIIVYQLKKNFYFHLILLVEIIFIHSMYIKLNINNNRNKKKKKK
jgi:hypothetical protein